ncbi:hypothetical protein [Rhizobium sp. CF142]|uniref:hypothetical protein n=1 Tax=Rhizobium sp. CF142 TaxID=1144314 RepID=UPI00026EFFA8|nr:hypothetical protein PMI11_05493 [Rhizobium sp. CF142]
MTIPRYGTANFDTLQCAAAGGRMTVKNRPMVYTHPLTGARSHLLTIDRMDGNQPMQLPDALRVWVMNDYRIELVGFSDGMRDRLRSLGLFSEMIAWKVRSFIPASDDGQAVLSRLIERHLIVDIAGGGDRHAARV